MADLADLPTTDTWWVRQRVNDRITLVTEPAVHRFLRCNVWHVRGRDADLVVDTGMGIRPLRPLVERELDGDLIAVATHSHGDHVGGLHEFDHRAIHTDDAPDVSGPQEASLVTADYGPKSVGKYSKRPASSSVSGWSTPPPTAGSTPDTTSPQPKRPAPSPTATSSTSATAPSKSSTCPGTRPARSVCGRRRPAPSSPVTPSTTARCSTSSPDPTSTLTSPRSSDSAPCRSRSSTAATKRRSVEVG